MYLVAGGSGFLGHYIIKNILELTDESILATYSSNLPDIKNDRLKWYKLDIQSRKNIDELSNMCNENTKIVYLCAYHHPDKVKENPELAWDINITSLSYFINKFSNAKCFYYSSTDSVYGEGSKDKFFNEDDRTNPVNLYGKHKALAEQITITHGGNVVRFPFIIGHSLVKHKKHFFDNILSDLREGKTVEMFEDSYRSTLDFNNCAKLLLKIIEKFGSCEEKIINIAGDKAMSKYDVAIAMCEKYNLDKSLVKPVSVKSFTGIFKEKRAENGVLNNSKLKKLLNIEKIELEFED